MFVKYMILLTSVLHAAMIKIMQWQLKKLKLTLATKVLYHNMERKGQPFQRGFNHRVMVSPR